MASFRVVICGGGIAAVEGLLRVRRLAGDAVDVTLVAPGQELVYRPLTVQEPFAFAAARRYPLRRIVSDHQAHWLEQPVEWIDPDAQLVHTPGGDSVQYDALLVAVGARISPAFEHTTVFDDAHADSAYHGLIQDVEGGYTKSVALVLPDGPVWPLPVYELALMTAERAQSVGFEDVRISIVTPEPAPLAAFGKGASDALTPLLESASVDVHANSRAEVPARGRVLVQPAGVELGPDRIVSLPRLSGPAIRGLSANADGFIPIDDYCHMHGDERIFVAGDATTFPVKHGGLGAQQADTAAAGMVALAGAEIEVEPLRPVIRGVLLTGREPLYLTSRLADGTGLETDVAHEPPWSPPDKVVAEELGPYLARLDA